MPIKAWDEVLETPETNDVTKELALWHLGQVVNARGLADSIRGAIHAEDWLAICSFTLDYATLSVSDALHLRQSLAFFQKRADLEIPGVDKEQAAVEKFEASERACAQTNEILTLWSQGRFQFPPDVEGVLYVAQRKIAEVLGDLPSPAQFKPRFGPGATTQVKKREASRKRKLSAAPSCSEDLLPVAARLLEEMPGWVSSMAQHVPKVPVFENGKFRLEPFVGPRESWSVDVPVEPGVLSFVLKNALTYRTVLTEPPLNGMYQLATGDYIAGRLRPFLVDTRDQSRNQRAARMGSLTGELATLDLSSASDTIAYLLVWHLLPPDWAEWLSYLRTGTAVYRRPDGSESVYKLEKFSSMGNGYTFPLESLIFWALSSACVPKHQQGYVCTYGDDIIVPTASAGLVAKVLTACGFTLNAAKSFTSGPFRESCGADYLSGIDIRPTYVHDKLVGEDLFRLHNAYIRERMYEPAQLVLQHIAPPLRIWGPDGYGDGHLLGDWTPVPHNHAMSRDTHKVAVSIGEPNEDGTYPSEIRDLPLTPGGWAGYTFETYSWKGRKDFKPLPGDYVFPVYSVYAREGATDSPWEICRLPIRSRARRFSVELADFHLRKAFWRAHTQEHRLVTHSQSHSYDARGRLGDTLPGKKGYKRISIYTLSV